MHRYQSDQAAAESGSSTSQAYAELQRLCTAKSPNLVAISECLKATETDWSSTDVKNIISKVIIRGNVSVLHMLRAAGFDIERQRVRDNITWLDFALNVGRAEHDPSNVHAHMVAYLISSKVPFGRASRSLVYNKFLRQHPGLAYGVNPQALSNALHTAPNSVDHLTLEDHFLISLVSTGLGVAQVNFDCFIKESPEAAIIWLSKTKTLPLYQKIQFCRDLFNIPFNINTADVQSALAQLFNAFCHYPWEDRDDTILELQEALQSRIIPAQLSLNEHRKYHKQVVKRFTAQANQSQFDRLIQSTSHLNFRLESAIKNIKYTQEAVAYLQVYLKKSFVAFQSRESIAVSEFERLKGEHAAVSDALSEISGERSLSEGSPSSLSRVVSTEEVEQVIKHVAETTLGASLTPRRDGTDRGDARAIKAAEDDSRAKHVELQQQLLQIETALEEAEARLDEDFFDEQFPRIVKKALSDFKGLDPEVGASLEAKCSETLTQASRETPQEVKCEWVISTLNTTLSELQEDIDTYLGTQQSLNAYWEFANSFDMQKSQDCELGYPEPIPRNFSAITLPSTLENAKRYYLLEACQRELRSYERTEARLNAQLFKYYALFCGVIIAAAAVAFVPPLASSSTPGWVTVIGSTLAFIAIAVDCAYVWPQIQALKEMIVEEAGSIQETGVMIQTLQSAIQEHERGVMYRHERLRQAQNSLSDRPGTAMSAHTAGLLSHEELIMSSSGTVGYSSRLEIPNVVPGSPQLKKGRRKYRATVLPSSSDEESASSVSSSSDEESANSVSSSRLTPRPGN